VAIYVATMPDAVGVAWLIERACEAADVRGASGIPPGVELVRRGDGSADWLFILNHSPAEVEVPLERPGVDILSGKQCADSVMLPPAGVTIVRSEEPGGR
jgi:beta-galactosidase